MAFQKFNQVGQAAVPDYQLAQMQDEESKANARALRNKDIMGGISLYNEAMGDDRNPISDYIGSFGDEGIGDMDLSSLTLPEAAGGEVAGDVMSGVMPELGLEAMAPDAGMNLASLMAPEAAAGGLEALGGIGALGGAAAPTAGMNASAIGAAMAPAAAEIGLGAGAAGAAGTALPPLGIAMALGSILGLFG